MSWDISIQDFPADAKQVADIPDDFQPKPLGARSSLIEKIEEVFPDADFSDPAWGILDRADFSIEFNIGEDEICEDLMLHVRGGGPAAVTAIDELLARLELRAIDCQTDEFFSVAAAEASFADWQAYRDKVIGSEEDQNNSE